MTLADLPAVSKHGLSELAMRGAIQFERIIAGMDADTSVFRALSDALLAVGEPSWNSGPMQYVAAGYLEPLEVMARPQHRGASIEAVQAYVKEVAEGLSTVAENPPNCSEARSLRDACLALHEGLMQDIVFEMISATDWQVDNHEPAPSISEA